MSENISDNPTVKNGRRMAPPAIGDIAEHFPQLEILEILGHGGMGVVYKARQKGLDRLVALKVLLPSEDSDHSFAERFGREARALASLQHPNIVTVHDSGQAGDLYYFIMEYMDGHNLRQLMSSGELRPEQALAIVPKICDALQYAHDEGVIHRDIKPENILTDTRGRVKIVDFGLVKLLSGSATDYTLTAPQQVMGTMHYMAPEQVERPGNVDHRADIYALGVVIYEMLTGELPIGRFPLPSEKTPVDARLDEIVLHALEKEPGRRYQRASEIKTDVEIVARNGGEAIAATPELEFRATSHSMRPPPPPPPPAGTSTMQPAAAPPAAAPPAAAPPGVDPWIPPKTVSMGYLLWIPCIFGLCGIQRMYTGRWVTGLLWLFTFGIVGIGQLIDLFLIPSMVRMANLESALLARGYPYAGVDPQGAPDRSSASSTTFDSNRRADSGV